MVESPSQGVKNALVISWVQICPYLICKAFMTCSVYKALATCYVAYGSLSKSGVLVMSWWWKRRLLPVERLANASSKDRRIGVLRQLARCWHSAFAAEREWDSSFLSGRSLFFVHASPSLPVRGLWELLHILIIILIPSKFVFLYLFIPYIYTLATCRSHGLQP